MALSQGKTILFEQMSRRAACIVYKIPLFNYKKAWRAQKSLSTFLRESRDAINADVYHRLIVVQHPSVYTLGRGSSLSNLKFDPNSGEEELLRVERGGEVTWHGPGQVVAYPIFDLTYTPLKKDLHWFMNGVEESVITTLQNYNVEGVRSSVNNGVWVKNNKIAAVGVTASRWITMHGLALNIDPDMDAYDKIVPCGITEPGHGVTSLSRELGQAFKPNDAHSFDAVATDLAESIGQVFDMDIVHCQNPDTELDIFTEMHPTADKLLPIER